MAELYRIKCSECPIVFESVRPDTKTHSGACRSRRSKRMRRQKVAAGRTNRHTPEQAEVAAIVRRELKDVAQPMIEEELRPVVREAITEDTLRAIQRMVALTPQAVEALEDDLVNGNPTLRQRAAKLVLQYTVGHPAVVRPEDTDPNQQLVVNFHLPRPAPAGAELAAEAEELRECGVCGAEKPLSAFVAASDRCQACHEDILALAKPFLDQQATDSTSEDPEYPGGSGPMGF